MSFSQHLVLWLHVAFVIFTIGPVTLAIMSTPRYIRRRDVRIVRYLSRITFVFMLGSLGVLIAGLALASMLSEAGKPWIIISATLFVVAIVLLALIVRDQRKAIRALEEAAAAKSPEMLAAQTAGDQAATSAGEQPAVTGQHQAAAAVQPAQVANVERGRIAMIGGVVSLIWLFILVLMIWNS
jgi:C4-dicarboxylate-specific signal transduction histidine kinase